MEYLHVRWRHGLPHQPTDIYSELDDERWETRKVEVFADGRIQYSDGVDSTGNTDLSDVPIPSFDEIARQQPFTPAVIDKAEFERVWDQATRPGADQPRS